MISDGTVRSARSCSIVFAGPACDVTSDAPSQQACFALRTALTGPFGSALFSVVIIRFPIGTTPAQLPARQHVTFIIPARAAVFNPYQFWLSCCWPRVYRLDQRLQSSVKHHTFNMKPAIDVQRLAGNRRRIIARKQQRSTTDFICFDQTA